MSVSPRSVRQIVVLFPQDRVQLRCSVLCWVMVAKQVRQKSRLTSATASGSTEMAYSSTRPRSRGVKACHGTQKDMERERDQQRLLLHQRGELRREDNAAHGGVPLLSGGVGAREEERGGDELRDVGGRGIVEDDLPLGEAASEAGGEERPALDALLEQLSDAAVPVQAHDADADALVAAEVEEGVEKGLLGLVAEGGEVTQHEEQRNVADLRLLQHLRVILINGGYELQKLHVLELSVAHALSYNHRSQESLLRTIGAVNCRAITRKASSSLSI